MDCYFIKFRYSRITSICADPGLPGVPVPREPVPGRPVPTGLGTGPLSQQSLLGVKVPHVLPSPPAAPPTPPGPGSPPLPPPPADTTIAYIPPLSTLHLTTIW